MRPLSTIAALGVASSLAFGPSATAQLRGQLRALAKSELPQQIGAKDQVIADFDGDGDLDVATLMSSLPPGNVLFLNDGRANFTAWWLNQPVDAYTCIAAGDVDGDGDADLVYGTRPSPPIYSGQTLLYLNRDGRLFDLATVNLPVDSDDTNAIALGDVDGDQDLDMVLGNGDRLLKAAQQTKLYLNDGKGKFTDATALRLPRLAHVTNAVLLRDVDKDGDLDLLLGNGTSNPETNRLYLNDGRGVFSDATATHLPAFAEATMAMALEDLDADTDLDLVLINDPTVGPHRVLVNDGSGRFAARLTLPNAGSAPYDVAVADVEGDGDSDLLVANHQSASRLWLNNGRALFQDATETWLRSREWLLAGGFADFDRDGDPDLFGCASQGVRLLINAEGTRFADTREPAFPAGLGTLGTRAITAADVDADGDLDVVLARDGIRDLEQSSQDELLINDGTGRFTIETSARLPKDADRSNAVVTADFDRDGDPDLAFGNDGRKTLYLNDGKGVFQDVTSTHVPADLSTTYALAAGDLNGDGWPDLVCGNYGQQNRLWVNDRTGRLVDMTDVFRFPRDSDSTRSLTLADVDRDGDLDLLVGNGRPDSTGPNEQSRLYLNNGIALFTDATATHLPQSIDATYAILAGDVDGDGNVDLFVANGHIPTTQQSRLYLNQGSGRFLDATAGSLPTGLGVAAAALLDLELDGDLDLAVRLVAGWFEAYANDGKGRFTLAPGVFDAANGALAVAADVDNDGDADVLTGSALVTNCLRQVHGPLLARLGRPYAVDVLAVEGSLVKRKQALPLVALRALPRPIAVPPYGQLGLDPSALLPLPMIDVYTIIRTSFPLPNDATLKGLTLYSQALVFYTQNLANARLTNVYQDTIF